MIYLRVSSEEQAKSGLGLEAQEARCREVCEAKGWEVASVMADAGVSGTVAPGERPGLSAALAMLCGDGGSKRSRARSRVADVLVIAKLDRAARSTRDLLWLKDEAEACGFQLVVLDVDIDTTTPAGELFFTMLAGMATFERRLIAQRTRDALQAKRARGARLGRPVTLPTATRSRVVELRDGGLSIAGVAAALNAEGVTQGNGAEWTKGAVQKVLRSVGHDEQAERVRALVGV